MAVKDPTAVLSEVDNEIHNLYEYCLAAGLTHEEIVCKAKPLLEPLGKELLKRKFVTFLKILAFCIIVGAAFSSDEVQRSMSMTGRRLLIKVLPLWDWTDIYHSNCFIYNPYFRNEQILATDCQVCEDVFEIDYLNVTSREDVDANYIQNDIPVIISGAMTEWPAMEDDFTLLNLTEGYLFANEIRDQPVCMLQTNLRVNNHRDLLRRILSEENIRKWYAHWENCLTPSVKFLRKFYNRPYFIPEIIQMTESNWLFMSALYKGKKFKLVDISPAIAVMWFAQLRGFHYIRLEPKSPCDEVCNILQHTIEEGDIVLFNPSLWKFLYLPGEKTENLAFAAGGFS